MALGDCKSQKDNHLHLHCYHLAQLKLTLIIIKTGTTHIMFTLKSYSPKKTRKWNHTKDIRYVSFVPTVYNTMHVV